jgi:predicted MFS family arabinose efflux permease
MRRRRLPAPLATLLAAWLLVSTARWAFMVALSVYAFDLSGAGGVGAVTAAGLLPSVLTAPVMGHLVDRVDRARVAALSCVGQAVCMGGAAALAGAGAALPWIVVLTALIAVAATAPRPALQALMPALALTPEQLSRATAVWSAVDNGGFLLGAGAGGIAITAFGIAAVLGAAAVMLVLAGVFAASLPSVRATALDAGADVEEGFADVLAGVRAVLRTPMLHVPYALFAGMLVLEGTSDVQLVALALGKLRMGSGGPGILYAVWGAGGIAGSALIGALVRRRGYGLALATGALALGAAIAVAGLDGVALAVITMVPAGVGFALVETAILGLVPRLADDAVIGRVYGLSELLYAGAAGVGALIAPALISALGVPGSLSLVGGALALGAVAGRAACARIDAGQEQSARIRELLGGIRFLAPLPLPRLERLVQGAHPITAPAGADIIRQGEPGEEFFVIEQGALDVVEVGRRLGPGEGFGEIALLRDVPRVATVRAASDVHLWSLRRPAFISAVSEHREARQLADAVIADSLAWQRVEED